MLLEYVTCRMIFLEVSYEVLTTRQAFVAALDHPLSTTG